MKNQEVVEHARAGDATVSALFLAVVAGLCQMAALASGYALALAFAQLALALWTPEARSNVRLCTAVSWQALLGNRFSPCAVRAYRPGLALVGAPSASLLQLASINTCEISLASIPRR